MMKKINKTVKEILENPELRKRAEEFEASEDEIDDEVDDDYAQDDDDQEEKEQDESDEYDDDDDFKEAQDNKTNQLVNRDAILRKDETGKSSSRFSRDGEDMQKSMPNTMNNK